MDYKYHAQSFNTIVWACIVIVNVTSNLFMGRIFIAIGVISLALKIFCEYMISKKH